MRTGYHTALLLSAIFLAPLAHAQGMNNRARVAIRAADGRPCLAFRTEARPEAVMKNAFDHLVRVTNSCPQRIIVDICYGGARSNCSRLDLGAYQEKTAFLGSMTNQAQFSFDYDERTSR